jgi:hypothetical protein
MRNSKALTVEVVLASGRQEDRIAFQRILAGSPWTVMEAATVEEATCALRHVEFPIVLFDPGLGGEQWETMLRSFLNGRRRTCVVLLLDECDQRSSNSIAFPQCDVLFRPLNREQLFSTLFLAYGRCKIYNLRFGAVSRLLPRPSL